MITITQQIRTIRYLASLLLVKIVILLQPGHRQARLAAGRPARRCRHRRSSRPSRCRRARSPSAAAAGSVPAPAPGRQLCTTSGGNTRPPVGAGAELFGVGLEELAARRPALHFVAPAANRARRGGRVSNPAIVGAISSVNYFCVYFLR